MAIQFYVHARQRAKGLSTHLSTSFPPMADACGKPVDYPVFRELSLPSKPAFQLLSAVAHFPQNSFVNYIVGFSAVKVYPLARAFAFSTPPKAYDAQETHRLGSGSEHYQIDRAYCRCEFIRIGC